MVCGTFGLDSREQALAVGGATVIGPFGRRGQVAARAVGEGHVLHRTRGHFDPDDASSGSGLLRTAARQRRNPRTGRAPSTVGLFRRRCSPSFTRRGWFASLGSFHTTGQGRGVGSRQSAAFPRRKEGGSIRLGSFAGRRAGSSREAGHAARSPRTAGELHGSCVGFRHRWRHHAPLGGSSRVVALSGVGVGEGSFDRPVQHANGAVAPAVLCDPVIAARGSFATLGRRNHDYLVIV